MDVAFLVLYGNSICGPFAASIAWFQGTHPGACKLAGVITEAWPGLGFLLCKAFLESNMACFMKTLGRNLLGHEITNLEERGLTLDWLQVQDAAVAAAEDLGLQYMKMVSRAYHDSLFMAQVAPTGMIFIPCRGGWSHRPDEYASPLHIEQGVKVLAQTLARLSTAAAHDTSEL